VDDVDNEGSSALHRAIWLGLETVMEELLEYCDHVDQFNKDELTPLHLASLFGQTRFVA
jgi:ankyrin repeat protein